MRNNLIQIIEPKAFILSVNILELDLQNNLLKSISIEVLNSLILGNGFGKSHFDYLNLIANPIDYSNLTSYFRYIDDLQIDSFSFNKKL